MYGIVKGNFFVTSVFALPNTVFSKFLIFLNS